MPSSATEGKANIKKMINKMIANEKFKFLDLGCGRGTYSRLIEKPCYRVGVDAMDYREKFELDKWYDKFVQHDIRDTAFLKTLGKYDLIIAGDVLEHMTVEEARKVIDTIKEMAEVVIIALPFEYPQYRKNNHWENHVQDDLTPALVKERYPEFVTISLHRSKQPPWNGKYFYGYYIWVKGVTKNDSKEM